jgi:hypothetical protein
MAMRTTTTIVCVVALLVLLTGVALFTKATVKAHGNIGTSSFSIEASDK